MTKAEAKAVDIVLNWITNTKVLYDLEEVEWAMKLLRHAADRKL